MADERTYLDRSLSYSETLFGQEATPDEFAAEFAKSDVHERTARIEHLKADMEGENLSVGQAAKMYGYHRAMINTHALLRKAGR